MVLRRPVHLRRTPARTRSRRLSSVSRVAIDGVGDDWFDDSAGNIDKCAPPTSTSRSVHAASYFQRRPGQRWRPRARRRFHARLYRGDNRSGTVKWAAFALDGTGGLNGSYTYSGTRHLLARCGGCCVGTSAATYEVFHQDGTSWTIPLPGPASKNTFTFNPLPLAAANVAFDGDSLFYGTLGSATTRAAIRSVAGSVPGNSLGRSRRVRLCPELLSQQRADEPERSSICIARTRAPHRRLFHSICSMQEANSSCLPHSKGATIMAARAYDQTHRPCLNHSHAGFDGPGEPRTRPAAACSARARGSRARQ